jgi:hypothetical protein
MKRTNFRTASGRVGCRAQPSRVTFRAFSLYPWQQYTVYDINVTGISLYTHTHTNLYTCIPIIIISLVFKTAGRGKKKCVAHVYSYFRAYERRGVYLASCTIILSQLCRSSSNIDNETARHVWRTLPDRYRLFPIETDNTDSYEIIWLIMLSVTKTKDKSLTP